MAQQATFAHVKTVHILLCRVFPYEFLEHSKVFEVMEKGGRVEIDEFISISLLKAEQAQSIAAKCSQARIKCYAASWETVCGLECGLNIPSLGQIHTFRNIVEEARSENGVEHICFFCGHEESTIMSKLITVVSLVAGSYLQLVCGKNLDAVVSAFQPLSALFVSFSDTSIREGMDDHMTVHDCWQAISTAKTNNWIDFLTEPADIDIDTCIDMEEYTHYDSLANGVIHTIIPSKLLAFPRPSVLPAVQGATTPWLDVDGVRHFGPNFYADVLGSEFGVSVVVRCDGDTGVGSVGGECLVEESDDAGTDEDEDGVSGEALEDRTQENRGEFFDSSEEAFQERGIAVERLCDRCGEGERGPPGGLGMLRDLDRFLTLSRLAPGAIALHGRGVGLGPGGEALTTALLMRGHGFSARAALAWTRLVHPAAPSPPVRFISAGEFNCAANIASTLVIGPRQCDRLQVLDPPGPSAGAFVLYPPAAAEVSPRRRTAMPVAPMPRAGRTPGPAPRSGEERRGAPPPPSMPP
jgi:hypothetical protein